jgi:hypothetical protein
MMAIGGPRARLIAAVAVLIALVAYAHRDIAQWLASWLPAPAPAPKATPVEPQTRLALNLERLGRVPVVRFAFDPETADRVMACDGISLDGGRTWAALPHRAGPPATVLGGRTPLAPVVGRQGRMLCGDVVLAEEGERAGLGEILPAAEWTEGEWRVALHAHAPAPAPADAPPRRPGFDVRAVAGIAYAPDGGALAAIGTRLIASSDVHELAGEVTAFASEPAGGIYAVVRATGVRASLVGAERPGASWRAIESPGEVRFLATAGREVVGAAGMLGRSGDGGWRWTRWPEEFAPAGLAASGSTVVAWGALRPSGFRQGVLIVSRDGGDTMAVVPLDGFSPVWLAVDPHHAGEFLAIDRDRELARIRTQPSRGL